MKNLKQSIIFQNRMVRFHSTILSIPLFRSNLYLVYLLFGITHNIIDNFSIHLFVL